jgi:hypothetical protein
MVTELQIEEIAARLHLLSDGQFAQVETVLHQLQLPRDFTRADDSDIVSDVVLDNLGEILRLHHCFSIEAFSKDRFEYAMERVFKQSGVEARLASKGNPGHDITIDSVRYSLKTQADKGIKPGSLWISKFMELGKGDWTDRDEDLEGLRAQFLKHMRAYDRILSLRCLEGGEKWRYELVEIPKSLLQEAGTGTLEMKHKSKQYPKPGYCYVKDSKGKTKFQLYFDGGSERKLQIKHLDKKYCKVHAEWKFVTS